MLHTINVGLTLAIHNLISAVRVLLHGKLPFFYMENFHPNATVVRIATNRTSQVSEQP